MTFRAFGLEAEIPLSRSTHRTARNFLAVHFEGDGPVVTSDTIMIPFGRWLTSLLAGERSIPTGRMGMLWNHPGSPNRKNIAMTGVVRRLLAIEHLNLNAAGKRHPDMSDRICPDKQPRIPTRFEMPPFQLDNEVLIHPLCS